VKYPEFRNSDFIQYFTSMLSTDKDRAFDMFEPLIKHKVGTEEARSAAQSVILRFYKGLPAATWKNVGKAALAAGATAAALKGVHALWKKWRGKKKPKPRPRPSPKPRPTPKPKAPKKKKKTKRRREAPAKQASARATRDDLLALFRRLDVDDSGKLDKSELGSLARGMNMTPGELLQAMDKDGDQGITYAEFRRFMRGGRSGARPRDKRPKRRQ